MLNKSVFRIVAAVFVAMLLFGYCSHAKPSATFTPLTPKNPTALPDAIAWAVSEYGTINETMTSAAEPVEPSRYKTDFQAANSLYKSGDYVGAKAAYADILTQCPVHLGARNNYILALVHCGEYDEALKNAVLLGLLHPSYEGNLVNILIPLSALGYNNASSAADLQAAGFPGAAQLNADMADKAYPDDISAAYAYNRVYADMEGQIGAAELQAKLAEYTGILQSLRDKSPGDTDYTELMTYFEGLKQIRTKTR
ncbi:MAG: hypothetical protein FWC60_06560 [Firmicutes bacterium]|nr:hypothetical protein [Bacillota bacterium]